VLEPTRLLLVLGCRRGARLSPIVRQRNKAVAIFKYLPSQYVDPFLDGAVRFQPLSYYRRWERDRAIGDPNEAMLLFSPRAGLAVHNLTTGQRFSLPASFVSSVVANDVWVFCVSQHLDWGLASQFGADACIEIFDMRRFVLKLQRAVKTQLVSSALLNRPVRYYETEDPAGVNWAIPDQIIFSKRAGYSEQAEYRFAFANRRVLKVGNAVQRIQFGDDRPVDQSVPPEPKALVVGDLRKITKVHSKSAV